MSEFNLNFRCTNCKEEFMTKDAAYLHINQRGDCMEIKEKFRVDIQGINDDHWANNGLTFDSVEEATKYARELSTRWFGFNAFRIVPVSTPTHELVDEKDRIPV